MGLLILVRHGEPGLKPDNRLAGWVDVPLSRKGIEEALECAAELGRFELDLAFASNLVRTQETLFIILSGQKKTGVVVHEGSSDGDSTGKIDWYSYPEKLGKKLIPIYLTSSLKSFPGRNLGIRPPGIFTVSPVFGFRPVRALRARRENVPKPTSFTSSPLLTV